MARKKRASRDNGLKRASLTYDGRRYYVYGFTESELEQKKVEKRQRLEDGTEDRVNPTFDRYYEIFTKNRREKVSENTLRTQRWESKLCSSIVIDSNGRKFGQLRLTEIKPDDIHELQRALKEDHTTETTNNVIDHLRHVFSVAVKNDYINKNPCDTVENLKRTEPPARETIHRALSETEQAAFFKAAKDSFFYHHFCVMIKTGIRVGELGALMSVDADSKENMLHINKTITRSESGGYFVGTTPKTDAGNRDIPVTLDILKHIKDQRNLNRMIYSDKVEKTIFRSPEGTLLREYSVNREIARICKRVGIEKFTCHAFRATFATRFIEQRPQDYKILSEILGHSNIKITLNLYTHVMKENKIKAMESVVIAI